MTSTSPTHPKGPAAAEIEIISGDDVRRFAERRLRWYGLGQIVIEDITRESDASIAVTIRDLACGRRFRKSFPTTLRAGVKAAPARRSLAA